MRDEELVLRDEEVTGELPEELEYQMFSEVNEQIAQWVEQELAAYKLEQRALRSSSVLVEYLNRYPQQKHFDVARIVIDQAVRLGVAQAELAGLPAKWAEINEYGAKVQAHVIDTYRTIYTS